MRSMRNAGTAGRLVALAGGLAIAAGVAAAQATAGPPAVSRSDFAASFIRFEAAALAAPLDEAATVRANRAFDSLTVELLTKGYAGAIRPLDELTASLDPKLGKDPDFAALASLRVRFLPPVWTIGGPPLSVRVESLYPVSRAGRRLKAVLRLLPPIQAAPLDVPLTVDLDEAAASGRAVPVPGPKSGWAPGRYRAGWLLGSGAFLESAALTVVRRSLDEQRAANDKELAAIKPAGPALEQALAAAKGRNALLTDSPPSDSSIPRVLDLAGLADAVLADISALRGGADPYKGRTGDTWRTFAAGERTVPARVFLSTDADRRSPLPLVVAFHGAAGDENLFMDGFGGILRRLAAERGFLLVTPGTSAFGFGEEAGRVLDKLLDTLSLDYPIDRCRVYLLGHSMGGMLAASLAAFRPERIAAAACLCGYQAPGAEAKAYPPVLVVAAELDPVVRPERVRGEFEKARGAGRPVELKTVPGYGHTLVVPKILPDAIAWLMSKRAAATPGF